MKFKEYIYYDKKTLIVQDVIRHPLGSRPLVSTIDDLMTIINFYALLPVLT